jgi:hypothetical protein
MKKLLSPPNVVAAVTSVSAVLATLKWIVDNVGGKSLPAQAILFYIPLTVVILYVGIVPILVGAGMVNAWVVDNGENSVTALVIGALLGAAVGAYFVYEFVFVNGPSYNNASSAARVFGAALGFLILAASILVYRHLKSKS